MVDDQGPDIVHEGPKTIYAQIVDYVEGLIVSVQGRGTYVKDPED